MFSKSHTTLLSASALLILSVLFTLSSITQANDETTTCAEQAQCVSAEAESIDECPSEETATGTMVVYSTAADGTINTLMVTEIPLSSVPTLTDAERVSGQPILVSSEDSPIDPNLHMVIYWQSPTNETNSSGCSL